MQETHTFPVETAPAPPAAGRLMIIHFDEVALKGGRRKIFVRQLTRNLRRHLPELQGVAVKSLYDRILLGPLDDRQLAAAQRWLPLMPGISWFSEVTQTRACVESLPEIAAAIPAGDPGQSFAVRARRAWKDFPINSTAINCELGRLIQSRTGQRVDLEQPDVTVHVDVTPQAIFTYFEKKYGPGGLPVGSTGKVVTLLSGGIDSPVAAYRMMCRGCKVVFVHFHNFGPQSSGVRRKLVDLVDQLSHFQGRSKLYLVPFGTVQSELIAVVPPRMRMVAYRRAMLRLTAPILEWEQGRAIIVGDSVGQVASQTLENLQATYPTSQYPILAPLIGDGKRTIMQQAKEIGTYTTSIQPYDDCCQLMVSRSPDTSCNAERLAEYESQLDFDEYCRHVLETAEVIELPAGEAS